MIAVWQKKRSCTRLQVLRKNDPQKMREKGILNLVKSMTGYGRAVETVNGRQFTVELRSVNNRYLDCSVKAPRMLSFAEEAVKQAVKNSISRGKVDVFITLHSENGVDATVTLNTAVVEGYLAAMEQMAQKYPVTNDISVSLLSRMPEVFSVEKPEVDEEQLQADLMHVVALALESYDAMRVAEGKALENDLRLGERVAVDGEERVVDVAVAERLERHEPSFHVELVYENREFHLCCLLWPHIIPKMRRVCHSVCVVAAVLV